MTLIQGRWYALPDGTRMRAVEYVPGRFRLDDVEREPCYLQDADTIQGPWRKVRYVPADERYLLIPCDLVTEQLVPVDAVTH